MNGREVREKEKQKGCEEKEWGTNRIKFGEKLMPLNMTIATGTAI